MYKYKEGEYVVYGLTGVCRVEGITTLNMKGIPADREYYSLIPLNQGGKIYSRVDSAQNKMRPIISRSEAELLIKEVDKVEPLKVTNDKTVEELYRNCMRSYDVKEWVRLIKCIYLRKCKRTESGKKLTESDHKYMRMAEDALYSELGIALGVKKEEVLDLILARH